MGFPSHLLFIDTETTTIKDDEEYHDPKLILGVCDHVVLSSTLEILEFDSLTFTSLDQLYDWIDSKCDYQTETYFFAHNWSFDFPIIDGFRMIKSGGYKMLSIVDGGPPTIIRYSKPGHKLTIIDSLNYFRQSLKQMGVAVGIGKIDIDLHDADIRELEIYCRKDVEILRTAVIELMRFLRDNNLTGLKHTVSSMALSTFIRKFLDYEILIDANPVRCSIGRSSYYGGRTECFRIGEYREKFYLIDINSQYPFVMRNNDYPTVTRFYQTVVDADDLIRNVHRYCYTVHADVRISEPYLPFKIDGRTCFPVGYFTTYLSTPEFEYAHDRGEIINIHRVVVYDKAPIFKRYVDYFYKKRLEYKKSGNDSYNEFSKKLLNTLYGKFGQQGEEWVKTDEPPHPYKFKWFDYDVDIGKRSNYMVIDGQVFRSDKQDESRDSFPAIAAHVTAHARMMVHRTINIVGRENTYYCDTDSLLLNRKGYEIMRDRLDPDALGCWALEGEYDRVVIRGPKDYQFGDKEKIKGVKYRHERTSGGGYRQIQFTNLKGVIRGGRLESTPIRHVVKHLERCYRKGVVGADGVVSPFMLYGD